jgi:hypothetical protein
MYPAMYTHIHSNDKAICNLREEVSMSMENKTRTTKKKTTCLVTEFQAAQVVGEHNPTSTKTYFVYFVITDTPNKVKRRAW